MGRMLGDPIKFSELWIGDDFLYLGRRMHKESNTMAYEYATGHRLEMDAQADCNEASIATSNPRDPAKAPRSLLSD